MVMSDRAEHFKNKGPFTDEEFELILQVRGAHLLKLELQADFEIERADLCECHGPD